MLLSRQSLLESLPASHIEDTDTDSEDAVAELRVAALHLKSSEIIRDIDPSGAYQLAYDGARKAIQALLMAFGLRITAAGGHYAFVKIAESGISANPGWLHFRVMRQQRNTIEYPEGSHQPLAPEAQVEAYAAAFEIIKDVEKLLNR